MTHRIREAHLPPHRTGLPSRIECTCGETVEAPTFPWLPDPHEPAAREYARHLARNGTVARASIANDHGSAGYAYGGTLR